MLHRILKHISPRAVAASAAVLACLLVGVYAVRTVQTGPGFQPSASQAPGFRENLIRFPEENTSPTKGSGEDGESWQQQDDAPDLKQQGESVQDPTQLPLVSDNTDPGENPGGADLPAGDGAVQPSTPGVIIAPDGTGNGTVILPGGSDIDEPASGGDGDSDASGKPPIPVISGGGDGSTSGGDSGAGDNGGGTPATPDVPTVTVPDAPNVDIKYDDLPDEPYIKGDIFNTDSGITSPDTTRYNYSLLVVQDDMGLRPDLARFYEGQQITAADFFQAAIFQVKEGLESGGANQTYRITNFGPNFRIGDFAPIVSGDSFTVTFYYRLNQDSPWQTVESTFPVEKSEVRLLVGNYDSDGNLITEGYGKPIRLYPSGREGTFDLTRYFYRAQPIQLWGGSVAPASDSTIDRLFVGWAVSREDAEKCITVGNLYETQPDRNGLIELYPVWADIPDGFAAELAPASSYYLSGSLNNDDLLFSVNALYQTITRIPSGEDENKSPDVALPRGSQILDSYHAANTLTIPDTLLCMNFSGSDDYSLNFVTVHSGYYADPANPVYASTEDGLMYNKDMTQLLGIPCDFDQPVTVPDGVSQVIIPYEHHFPSMVFLGEAPSSINVEPFFFTDAVDIYFPSQSAVDYFSLFSSVQASEGGYGCNLYTLGENGVKDAAPVDLVETDGLITSKDGETLYSIQSTVSGTCILPEGIKTIASGALSNAHSLTTLILPESLEKLESSSLYNWGLQRVLFMGATPPVLEDGAIDPFTSVLVRTESKAAYEKAWGEAQTFTTAYFGAFESEDGRWKFLLLPEGATLLHAPTDLTEFNKDTLKDILPDGMSLTTIDEYAFEGCENLTLAIFPESVTTVNDYSFWGCTSLEGIFFQSEDVITIADHAFYIADWPLNQGALRFVVLQAQYATFSYSFSDRYVPLFIPSNGVGYPDTSYFGNIKAYGDGYDLEEHGSGVILYSKPSLWKYADDDPDPAEDDQTRVLCATTTGVSGNIDLSNVIWINQSAFKQCPYAFTLVNADRVWIVGYEAFLSSGLTGDLSLRDARTIGSSAFQRTALTSVDLSSPKLEYIDDFAFTGCRQLTTLKLDLNSTMSYIGSSAFQLTALTSFTVPANVTMLGNDVVSGCPLNSITFLSAEAPRLSFFVSQPIYLYQRMDDNENILGPGQDFRVVLEGDAAGHEMDYMFAWRSSMAPIDRDTYDTNLLTGENNARQVLGLDQVDEVTPETELPELPSWSDDLMEIPGPDLEPDPDLNGDNGSTGDTDDVELIPDDSEVKQLPDDEEDLETIPDPDEGDSTPEPDTNEPDDSTQSGGEDAPEEGETV